MKHIAVILLVPIMLMQSCAALFIMTAFYANRTYIAKNLCDYRDRPVSMCGGQCVLTEKLKKEQEREEKQPDLKFKEVQLLVEETSHLLKEILTVTVLAKSCPPYIKPIYAVQFTTGIFHPPLA